MVKIVYIRREDKLEKKIYGIEKGGSLNTAIQDCSCGVIYKVNDEIICTEAHETLQRLREMGGELYSKSKKSFRKYGKQIDFLSEDKIEGSPLEKAINRIVLTTPRKQIKRPVVTLRKKLAA